MRPEVWDTVCSNEASFLFGHCLQTTEVWASSDLCSVGELTLQLNNTSAWLKPEYCCGRSSLQHSRFGMEKRSEFGGIFDLKTDKTLELWSIFCWLKN